jgi:transcription-repair coupling factor (superfamily II helicase)
MSAPPIEPDPWLEPSRRLASSAPFELLRAGTRWARGLPVPAAAWVFGLLAEQRERPLLAVVPRESDALAWLESAQMVARRPERALYFPSPSLTPYQETEASLLVRAQETVALDAVRRTRRPWVVCTPRSLFRRLPPLAGFGDALIELVAGDERPPDRLAAHLVRYGYRRGDLVADVGSFAVRGGVFDLFPPGEPGPVRLDLFGDQIESIRRFDPVSQRSAESLEQVTVLPMSLVAAGLEEAAALADRLRRRVEPRAGSEAAERIAALERGETFPGWENYLPALGAQTTDLASLLEDALVVAVEPELLRQEARHQRDVLEGDWRGRRDQGRLALPPDELALPLASVLAAVDSADVWVGDPLDGAEAASFGGVDTDRLVGQFPRFPREVLTARERGERVFLVSPAAHHARLGEVLRGREVTVGPQGVELVDGELRAASGCPRRGLGLRARSSSSPRAAAAAGRARGRLRPFLSGLRDLKVGEHVVHEDHGIGQYTGMRNLAARAGESRRRPPAAGARRYGGRPTPRRRGDGDHLLRRGKHAAASARPPRPDAEVTAGSRACATPRQAGRRELGEQDQSRVKKLAATWRSSCSSSTPSARSPARRPRSPDSDGLAPVRGRLRVRGDARPARRHRARSRRTSSASRPMDRLLVRRRRLRQDRGGHARRLQGGRRRYQVAVLAPTTMLADQHLETFRDRFAGFPVNVEMISRFRRRAEMKETLSAPPRRARSTS